MQQTMKQYITAMRINHVRALLSDTDKTILDIALPPVFAQQPLLQHLYPLRGHAAAAVP